MALAKDSRDLWIFLMQNGGAWTCKQIAETFGGDSQEIHTVVNRLMVKKYVEILPPAEGSRWKRYMVTGLCKVPSGMYLAEVQA